MEWTYGARRSRVCLRVRNDLANEPVAESYGTVTSNLSQGIEASIRRAPYNERAALSMTFEAAKEEEIQR
jgi:hypothetical protein